VKNKIDSRWLDWLPFRWAVGGLLLGVTWSAISIYLQDSLQNPIGGTEAGLLRVTLIFVLPLALLGLVWGYSERAKLVRCANESNAALVQAIRRTTRRQVGKAILCGFVFGIFVRSLDGSAWNSSEHIAANLGEAFGSVWLAIPVGLIVGFRLKRNLSRRLELPDSSR
jgi:hypothetical protein